MLIAAIDQGTTSTKCLLVDDAGNATTVGAIRHRQILPRDGWVEHDAAELLANVRELFARAVDAGAEALALANQGETVVAWDRRDRTADLPTRSSGRTRGRLRRWRRCGRPAWRRR